MIKIFLRKFLLLICIILLGGITACGNPPVENVPTGNGERPYLKSEASVKYNNEPVTFEFVLNGYELILQADNLTEQDYGIENGVLTLYTEFFERENKKEYVFTYSLVKGDTHIEGALTVISVKWSDITWH